MLAIAAQSRAHAASWSSRVTEEQSRSELAVSLAGVHADAALDQRVGSGYIRGSSVPRCSLLSASAALCRGRRFISCGGADIVAALRAEADVAERLRTRFDPSGDVCWRHAREARRDHYARRKPLLVDPSRFNVTQLLMSAEMFQIAKAQQLKVRANGPQPLCASCGRAGRPTSLAAGALEGFRLRWLWRRSASWTDICRGSRRQNKPPQGRCGTFIFSIGSPVNPGTPSQVRVSKASARYSI